MVALAHLVHVGVTLVPECSADFVALLRQLCVSVMLTGDIVLRSQSDAFLPLIIITKDRFTYSNFCIHNYNHCTSHVCSTVVLVVSLLYKA